MKINQLLAALPFIATLAAATPTPVKRGLPTPVKRQWAATGTCYTNDVENIAESDVEQIISDLEDNEFCGGTSITVSAGQEGICTLGTLQLTFDNSANDDDIEIALSVLKNGLQSYLTGYTIDSDGHQVNCCDGSNCYNLEAPILATNGQTVIVDAKAA